MANLNELIQKLSEKSKALTYDSGRWDSTQLAKKTKELTELLPEILNEIIDAIPEGNEFVPQVDVTSLGDIAHGVGVSRELALKIQSAPAIRYQYGFEVQSNTSMMIPDRAVWDAIKKQYGLSHEMDEVLTAFGTYSFNDGSLEALMAVTLYTDVQSNYWLEIFEI